MLKPNQKLVQTRAQRVYNRAKISYARAAKLSGLSVNTVKKIVSGQHVHQNSCLRLERALDAFLLDGADRDADKLQLVGTRPEISVALFAKLSETLHNMLQEEPDETNRYSDKQIQRMNELYTACSGHLKALRVLPNS